MHAELACHPIPAIIHHAPVPGRNRRDERDRHQTSCLSSQFCGPTHMIVSTPTIDGYNDTINRLVIWINLRELVGCLSHACHKVLACVARAAMVRDAYAVALKELRMIALLRQVVDCGNSEGAR